MVVRAHQVAGNSAANGLSIANFEKMHDSLTIERVVHDGLIIERDEGLTLRAGDIVGVYALRESVGPLSQWVGPEIDHAQSLSFPTREVDIVPTSPEFAGKTISPGQVPTGKYSAPGLLHQLHHPPGLRAVVIAQYRVAPRRRAQDDRPHR